MATLASKLDAFVETHDIAVQQLGGIEVLLIQNTLVQVDVSKGVASVAFMLLPDERQQPDKLCRQLCEVLKKMAWVAQHTQVELMVESDHSKLTLLQRLTRDGELTGDRGEAVDLDGRIEQLLWVVDVMYELTGSEQQQMMPSVTHLAASSMVFV
ncbi:hypothetical protein [Photobacterium sp. OFAV2-7]|uniref:hypothetical protein n=1 Tax=Photobacterium sp. OFAV2-7 TaxID=2917748 RepID=UPI001EF4E432|nr:hypothetical protein [Photobacterium sp. OFAV2-7]MCG7587426.1 hypothetical protein [Photobacterium sp. OFAV2-7]